MYIQRNIEPQVLHSIANFSVTAIIGPRQCGKSTLVKEMLRQIESTLYLDLERPSDLKKLDDAEWFLSSQKGKLICIDEIQRKPELFPLIRSLVDEWGTKGSFLILGSASRDLLKQSSETLAGRIRYLSLTPLLWSELVPEVALEDYIFRGGVPLSISAIGEDVSVEWRDSFIQTFLERDLLQWSGFTPQTMRRLWQMLAHMNGQTVNYSMLSNSLGFSAPTIKSYIDLLDGTFMLEVVPPYFSNLGKRLVKAPKIYVSDSGICATLLGITSFEEYFSHPSFGSIWEQIVLTNIKGLFPKTEVYHYRTSNGSEVDFVLKMGKKTIVVECKSTMSPTLSKGNYNAFEDIQPDSIYIVCPISDSWSMSNGIKVIGLGELPQLWE